jgi:LmbE family N-acetylglucosaminyl deacetylase
MSARLSAPSTAHVMRYFNNVLVIFPHAGDETVSCGGTIRRLANAGALITLVLLTGGERSNPSGTLDLGLKAIRRYESERAAKILGISRVIQEYFPAGRLFEQTLQVKSALARTMTYVDPDLILTCEAGDLEGHPDHVACNEVVTEMRGLNHPRVPLWYAILPVRPLTLLQLASPMAHGPRIDGRRSRPTHRVFLGFAAWTKVRASREYRSQHGAIRRGIAQLIPPWIAVGLSPFEYFADA